MIYFIHLLELLLLGLIISPVWSCLIPLWPTALQVFENVTSVLSFLLQHKEHQLLQVKPGGQAEGRLGFFPSLGLFSPFSYTCPARTSQPLSLHRIGGRTVSHEPAEEMQCQSTHRVLWTLTQVKS